MVTLRKASKSLAVFVAMFFSFFWVDQLEKSGYEAVSFDKDVNHLSTSEQATAFRFFVDPAHDAGGSLSLSLTAAERRDKVSGIGGTGGTGGTCGTDTR